MPVRPTDTKNLDEILHLLEGENVEFKEAKNSFEFENLVKYACAIANCGGGHIVLGVSDKRPRTIVGTNAFLQPERTRMGLVEQLHLKIDVAIHQKDEKRVLIFHVPSRPVGSPIQCKGTYWSRECDKLVPMSEEELRAIFSESGHDFSADVCREAEFGDLDEKAIEDFRKRWITKSRNSALANLSLKQLLDDCEATIRGKITYAALILFGTREALGRLLGQSEVVFEYRSSEASGPAQFREEFRQGFFTFYDKLWELVNLRNDKQHFQDGLFVLDVPTFEERIVREAILNAVSHRDYQLGGSVFIRQYPRKLLIDSPGGLPPDITVDNILDRQSPRNRRIADIFAKCGLVERSGQGMNLMYELSIKNSKLLPDLRGTDRYHVTLTLDGQIQDPKLLQMMEKIGQETLESFNTHDFLIVDLVHREKPVPSALVDRLPRLLDLGIIERVSRGHFMLGRQYYQIAGKTGVYTRKKGLDRDMCKALILKHVMNNKKTGSKLCQFLDVLPGYSRGQIQTILRELRNEGKIRLAGNTSNSLWFPID
ncbi:MAG: ATP-binding protein [Candidatus Wallbacteria bacterium]